MIIEHFDHDDCPKCGTPSVPFEGVLDQTLRGCEKCDHEWWEDLNSAPSRGVNHEHHSAGNYCNS